MSETINYDEQKFRELMLYIAARMEGDPAFGATKLNKMLFFADFSHYVDYGQPITGAEYQKLPHGPAPRRLLPVQKQLQDEGDATIRHMRVGGYTQKRLVPLRDADLSYFSGSEIATVEETISRLEQHTALSVSAVSHRMFGWQIAREGQTIPYQSAFLYSGPVTDADEVYAKEVASNLAEQLVGAGVGPTV